MQEQCPATEEAVWQQFSTCYFKFGILAKKSTSGKKLFLKSIQIEDKEDTLSVKSIDTLAKEHSQIEEEGHANDAGQEQPAEEKKMDDSPP